MNTREAVRRSFLVASMSVVLFGEGNRVCAADEAPAPIPFRMHGHLIVVRVGIADLDELQFAIDTGSSFTVLSKDLGKRLRLKGEQTEVSAWGRSVRATEATVAEIRMGELRFSGIDVRIADLPVLTGLQLDGLIGLDFLRQSPVTIDFRSQTIQFGSNRTLQNSLRFYPGFPFIPINLKVQGEVLRVVVDTGAAGLMLYGKAIRGRFKFPRNGRTETRPYAGGRCKMDTVLVQRLTLGESSWDDVTARILRDEESGNEQVMGNLGVQSLGLSAIQLDLQAGRLSWEQ